MRLEWKSAPDLISKLAASAAKGIIDVPDTMAYAFVVRFNKDCGATIQKESRTRANVARRRGNFHGLPREIMAANKVSVSGGPRIDVLVVKMDLLTMKVDEQISETEC